MDTVGGSTESWEEHSLEPGCLGLSPDAAFYSCAALGKFLRLSVHTFSIFKQGVMIVLLSQGDYKNEILPKALLTGPDMERVPRQCLL